MLAQQTIPASRDVRHAPPMAPDAGIPIRGGDDVTDRHVVDLKIDAGEGVSCAAAGARHALPM